MMYAVCYQQKRSCHRGGYTLIEIVTALAMFSIIMLSVTRIFTQGFASYHESKKTQTNLETAHNALNLIAKELRTASVVQQLPGAVTSTIVFYDYSQAKCIKYVLTEGAGTAGQITREDTTFSLVAPNNTPDDYLNACSTYTFPGGGQVLFTGLTNQVVSAANPSTTTPPHVGRVTLSLTVGTGSNETTLQTSVSLRDFNNSGL